MALRLEEGLKLGIQTIHREGDSPTGPWQPRIDDLVSFIEDVDAKGFDEIWLGDHVSFAIPFLDPLLMIAQAAVASRRLVFGTGVYLLPLRHPGPVAKMTATLDHLTEGRFIFGVGVGGEFPKEYEVCGVPREERGRRLTESIEAIRALWSGRPASYSGRYFSLQCSADLPAEARFGDQQLFPDQREWIVEPVFFLTIRHLPDANYHERDLALQSVGIGVLFGESNEGLPDLPTHLLGQRSVYDHLDRSGSVRKQTCAGRESPFQYCDVLLEVALECKAQFYRGAASGCLSVCILRKYGEWNSLKVADIDYAGQPEVARGLLCQKGVDRTDVLPFGVSMFGSQIMKHECKGRVILSLFVQLLAQQTDVDGVAVGGNAGCKGDRRQQPQGYCNCQPSLNFQTLDGQQYGAERRADSFGKLCPYPPQHCHSRASACP